MTTALQQFLRIGAPDEVIDALIAEHPAALEHQTLHGSIPLHTAVSRVKPNWEMVTDATGAERRALQFCYFADNSVFTHEVFLT